MNKMEQNADDADPSGNANFRGSFQNPSKSALRSIRIIRVPFHLYEAQ